MADKKLNAVSTASNGAYIYAEDASGNQIKISKADLATVVAGLLPLASLTANGLVKKECAQLVNGRKGWAGSGNIELATVVSTYFCAMVVISRFNEKATVYIVSVGDPSVGLKTTEIANGGRTCTFTVSDGKLYVDNVIDCSVRVVVFNE